MKFFRALQSVPEIERPTLDLSGPILTAAIERLAMSCEATGGIEAYVEALRLKGEAFSKIFADAGDAGPSAANFAVLAGLMPTVRRRIAPWLESGKFEELSTAVRILLSGPHDPLTVDRRIAEFCVAFPQDKKHRWVRDLAAELLHGLDPERYPLMCRWVWDRDSNTGVIREIWHGNVDRETLQVPGGYATFVMLREELSQFLSENGVFQSVLHYVDLIMAQVYAEYISAQGGSYLRADFSSAEDTIHHLRRLLGLDGVRIKPNEAPASAVARLEMLPSHGDQ